MKPRILFYLVFIFSFLWLTGSAVFADGGKIRMIINGEPLVYDEEVYGRPYVDENSRTLVPLRIIAENLKETGDSAGYSIEWREDAENIAMSKAGRTLMMQVGNHSLRVDHNQEYTVSEMNTAPVLLPTGNGETRTYVPVRFLSEALGWEVEWVENNGDYLIIINSPEYLEKKSFGTEQPVFHPSDEVSRIIQSLKAPYSGEVDSGGIAVWEEGPVGELKALISVFMLIDEEGQYRIMYTKDSDGLRQLMLAAIKNVCGEKGQDIYNDFLGTRDKVVQAGTPENSAVNERLNRELTAGDIKYRMELEGSVFSLRLLK